MKEFTSWNRQGRAKPIEASLLVERDSRRATRLASLEGPGLRQIPDRNQGLGKAEVEIETQELEPKSRRRCALLTGNVNRALDSEML